MGTHTSIDERYEFSGRVKTWSLIAIVLGVVGVAYGFLIGGDSVQRTFSNLLLASYYFACVCTAAVFFLAYQYVAQAGWSAALLRVPQAMAKVLPIAAVIFIVVALAGLFTTHEVVNEEGHKEVMPYLYGHWAAHGLTDPSSEHYDPIIAGKSSFLNIPFFAGVIVVLLGLYSLFGYLLVKFSQNEDQLGGMFNYDKSFKYSAIFLVIFGFTFPVFAFDAIMSLEAHWFSTMFGWYNLAAAHVSGLAVITLLVIYLRKKGYMQWISENHLHDLGKLMFAFSIFWTYVWFGQFFLIWYANMPEETVYFYKRWEPEYKWWFWLNIVLNFVAPLLLLMSRDAKRLTARLQFTAWVLIIGHWLDYYLMIMPGTIHHEAGHEVHIWDQFGLQELLIFVGFAGILIFLTLNSLSKFTSLVPKKHPFLDESLHHHQ
ncbi:quinol:cytochrome C oxidoreductase [Mucilaginibacter limnophilus]|uniref:Quinol:cytochrome C oxidoreductase n=1 Tax=Mucilaginibacter limnophilus TaxID=1932778 RepID=A0A3S2Y447_9SPHI|nr:quinol:cytochrome C oxidoreductase [Mucilaginibacter limnophilus]RVU01548.1 quinol:cytochrome C oxidoreductase [Mucilaginibacter limnophilus]